ncbi:class I SAM-dependent DNA methyltransferase [Micromonospora sp. U21]|uniref:HsdM family class I SAM-dependent methyltransferase n=1 Tax=Micromonospora sp. U21 TaxID=2824899 RepID=UPI001B3901DB|nr:N-6 DNA methylase [Micromonospora sp. U21]MBQ0903576.1 N-6 DNA methylase [Micromonospora sp. U21]
MPLNAGLPDSLVTALEELDYLGHDGLLTTGTDHVQGPRDYVWRDLHNKVGLDAAFFHDGVPLVGFTTYERGPGLFALRRRLWNYGRIPLLISAGATDITAFNAVDIPSLERDDTSGLVGHQRRSGTARRLLDVFGRLQIQAGTFAQQHARSFARASRVSKALLSNLHYLRMTIAGDDPRRRMAVDQVIGGCLVTSYLAHRGILDQRHFADLSGRISLQEALNDGRQTTRALFEGLAEHFNGDVFGPVPEALQTVSRSDLRMVSSFLNGDHLPTGQQSLYPYDFSVLPSDLVSSIYEQLLEDNRRTHGAYYTPKFLVDLVLDEVLPWAGPNQPRLIDLACGSGAFMTEAFRRLAYRERRAQGSQLAYSELTQLLKNHIFGVERNPDAARVAAFGLYLALLEELDPPTVWDEVVLPKLLNDNIVVADAFEEHHLSGERFDAVVSNPPWRSKLTAGAARFVRQRQLPIADQQMAQAFLWLAKESLAPSGKLGLVMPAKPLLHNRSGRATDFRYQVFSQLNVTAVIDLSAVRRSVFATAIAPSAVIVAEAMSELEDGSVADISPEILHIAAHPRPMNTTLDALQIIPEEVRTLSRRQAQVRSDIWKVLLWGGYRDLQLIDWLKASFPSVQELVTKNGWIAGQGYQPNGGDRNDAAHLLGMPDLDASFVLPVRIAERPVETFQRPYLHRTRDERLFRGPHVLIRTTFVNGRLAAVLVDEDVVFRHGVMGFAGPLVDRPLLAMLAATTVSSLGHYFHFMTSAAWGVERDFVELNEHLSLPLATPTAAQYEELSDIFRRAEGGMTDQLLRRLDEIVFAAYKLTTAERARVMERLQFGLGRFRRPTAYFGSVHERELDAYQDQLCGVLSGFFSDMRVTSLHEARNSYRAVAVTIRPMGDERGSPQSTYPIDIEGILRSNPIDDSLSTAVVAQPAGFFVDDDTVYIVKTSDRDRWSIDAALDDADRIITALAFGS